MSLLHCHLANDANFWRSRFCRSRFWHGTALLSVKWSVWIFAQVLWRGHPGSSNSGMTENVDFQCFRSLVILTLNSVFVLAILSFFVVAFGDSCTKTHKRYVYEFYDQVNSLAYCLQGRYTSLPLCSYMLYMSSINKQMRLRPAAAHGLLCALQFRRQYISTNAPEHNSVANTNLKTT